VGDLCSGQIDRSVHILISIHLKLLFSRMATISKLLSIVLLSFTSNLVAQNDLLFEKTVMALQFDNSRNDRRIIIREGKPVKVFCRNTKGRLKFRKAVLLRINKDSIIFRPKNKNWEDISYCVDCGIYQNQPELEKISFITGGSITRFTLFHSGVALFFYEVATNPVVALPVLLICVIAKPFVDLAAVAPSNARKVPYPGSIRTHINSNPKKKWNIHVVEVKAK